MHELRFEQWVPLPVGRVFRFFAEPRNLPRLTPEYLRLRVEAMQLVAPRDVAGMNASERADFAGRGSTIVVSFRPSLTPLRLKHTATISEFEWGSHFQDEFRNWQMDWRHRHEFEAAPREGVDGTMLRDIVRVKLLLGALAFPLIVKPMLERMFDFRQRKLDELVRQGEI